MEQDQRWKQRFAGFTKALQRLTESVDYLKSDRKTNDNLNDIESIVANEMIREGFIHRFEFTYELA